MARNCGCAGSSCGCSIVSGDVNVVVEGVGSAKNPYVIKLSRQPITGQFVVTDSSSIDFTLTGSGTVADPYNLTGTTLTVIATGAWGSTITNLTLGASGTDVNSYRAAGKRVRAKRILTLGTAPAVGDLVIPLPVALPTAADAQAIIGRFTAYDVSATALYTGDVFGDGGTANIKLRTGSPSVAVGAASPFTWAVGDKIIIDLDYTGV